MSLKSTISFFPLVAVSSVLTFLGPVIFNGYGCGAEPEHIQVFAPGMNGVAHYRIPGIVVTAKGTVLAYSEARKNSRSDWGEIEVHLRRSLDGGKTWEPSQSIAHRGERIEGNPTKKSGGESEQTVNNPVAIVDRTTSSIEMLYCVNYARCFSIRSEDEGANWSDPVEITSAFEAFRKEYPWTVIATGPGHGIQLKSGRLVVPIWLAYGKNGAHAPSACGTIFSDDHGKTWQAGDISTPNNETTTNPNETMIAETHSGSVYLITRSVSKANRKIVTVSPNGATEWTTPRFADNLWEPVCMSSLVQYPHQAATLIYSGPRTLGRDVSGKEIPAGRGKRKELSLQLSHDDGKNWEDPKLLVAGPSAYSDLAVLPDGTVLCLYEGDLDIQLARIPYAWLGSNQ